ncbi:MAG: heat-inducible transcriptional repressor HrcA [Acidobacteriota bacterium]
MLKELDSKSKEVLESIVIKFISSGMPVGSKAISKKDKAGYSPATIRNIMAELETRGLVFQPHTSAGRVPTDMGYRFYVDSLMKSRELSCKEEHLINKSFDSFTGNMENLMEAASSLLSNFSENAGMVLQPKLHKTKFKDVRFIKLNHSWILVILVSQGGFVFNKVITIEEEIPQSELDRIANYLVEQFSGLTLMAVKKSLVKMLSQERAFYKDLLKGIIFITDKRLSEETSADALYFSGTSKLLEQPEFYDLKKARELFKAIEDKEMLVKILTRCLNDEGVRVIIGSENICEGLRDFSLITSIYKFGSIPLGLVGILGPTRMDYAKGISLVDYISRSLSKIITEYAT